MLIRTKWLITLVSKRCISPSPPAGISTTFGNCSMDNLSRIQIALVLKSWRHGITPLIPYLTSETQATQKLSVSLLNKPSELLCKAKQMWMTEYRPEIRNVLGNFAVFHLYIPLRYHPLHRQLCVQTMLHHNVLSRLPQSSLCIPSGPKCLDRDPLYTILD